MEDKLKKDAIIAIRTLLEAKDLTSCIVPETELRVTLKELEESLNQHTVTSLDLPNFYALGYLPSFIEVPRIAEKVSSALEANDYNEIFSVVCESMDVPTLSYILSRMAYVVRNLQTVTASFSIIPTVDYETITEASELTKLVDFLGADTKIYGEQEAEMRTLLNRIKHYIEWKKQ